ncbi:hypothetical protein ACFOWM_03500 [Ferruginibacter yonginensis]|uniref:Phospholipase D-like domain-containing protein n=1 Tax=Ferruginibacter yonginensis TaxID=1310416 RepID=A0ABV8QSP1_9BACT
MALIEFTTNNKVVADPSTVFAVSNDVERPIICKSPERLKLLLGAIAPCKSVHYVSKGDWSMHDLVMQLVNKYNPATIYMTTYALRETPLRQLVMAQQKGLIASLNMLIDYRAKVRTPEVYQLAAMNANKIAMVAIHAKVCVIQTAAISISIVTSSNWTTNPKIEAGVVTMDKAIGDFHIDWINKTMDNANIFRADQ